MTGLGLISTAAAWLNLRKAKAEYAALKEQQEGLQAAIQAYQHNRYDATEKTPQNNMPAGVEYAAMLRVANVVGRLFKARASLVLTNTSNQTYYIRYAMVDTFFDKEAITICRLDWKGLVPSGGYEVPQNVLVDKLIKPGQIMEIKLDGGIATLPDEQMNKLREVICAVAGKKVVTSILYPTNVPDGITADIKIGWEIPGTGEMQEGWTLKKIGVLRYMRETSNVDNG